MHVHSCTHVCMYMCELSRTGTAGEVRPDMLYVIVRRAIGSMYNYD